MTGGTKAQGEGREGRGPSRRGVLRAGLAGGALAAGLPLAAACDRAQPHAAAEEEPAAGAAFSSGWLFGGEYVSGSERAGYDDSAFTPVTLPHTVASLSYAGWDPATWEKVWIYRRQFRRCIPAGQEGVR